MATAARLPIVADRAGACVRTIDFKGLDLTGITLAMEIRLYPDQPGAAKVTLGMAASNAEGLSLAGVSVSNGIPTSRVQIRINEATMEDNSKIVYSGEIGTPSELSYGLIGIFGGDKRTLTYGPFIALPTTYGADNAPATRVAGSGTKDIYSAWNNARGTFSNDATVVTVNGVDLIEPLVVRAEDAAEAGEASAAASTASSAASAVSAAASAESAAAAHAAEANALGHAATAGCILRP
jgi:hypothetical protein